MPADTSARCRLDLARTVTGAAGGKPFPARRHPPRFLHPRRRRLRRRLREPQRRRRLQRRARQRGGKPRAHGGGARRCGRSGFITAYQIHSPDVVVADAPWTAENRPRADAIVTRTPQLGDRRLHRRLRTGAVCRRAGARHRRRACRLARRVHRRHRGDHRGDGKARRRPHPHRRRARPDHPPANYEVGPEFVARFTRPTPATRTSSSRRPSPATLLFDLPGYIAARIRRAGIVQFEDLGLCTYAEPRTLLQFPPHDPSRRARLRTPCQRHRACRLKYCAACALDSVPDLSLPLQPAAGDKDKNAAAGVAMQGCWWRRIGRAAWREICRSRWLLAAAGALALSACTTDGQPSADRMPDRAAPASRSNRSTARRKGSSTNWCRTSTTRRRCAVCR